MKMHLLLTTLTICFLPLFSFSQAIQWQNTIGGSEEDLLYSIVQTSDGGYIFGGYSLSNISGDKIEDCNGASDYWIVKTDSSGTIQWQNTIGGNLEDDLQIISQTSDGGYILGGHSSSNISGDKTENTNGLFDCWIVKINSAGAIQWQNSIGGGDEDYLNSLAQTSDGGYILGGSSQSNISGDKTENNFGATDYWIVKINNSGVIQWQNTIGGSDLDGLRSMAQTSDGGYILGGFSYSNISGNKTENSNGNADYWIVKTDSTGDIQWQNTIGGSMRDELYSIKQTSDGGYILGGWSESSNSGDKTENSNGGSDYWIVKTDSVGTIQWEKTIGGSDDDYLFSNAQTSNEGYLLGGWSDSNISGDKTEDSNGSFDYWIIKTDSTGVIQWQNTIGGSNPDLLNSNAVTSDGGYILGGMSTSDISGDKTEDSNGSWDYWIVKIQENPTSIPEFLNETDGLHPYPNPATTTLTIETRKAETTSKLIVTDVAGRTLLTKTLDINSNRHQIDIASFSAGIYFVQVEAGESVSRGRFVKE